MKRIFPLLLATMVSLNFFSSSIDDDVVIYRKSGEKVSFNFANIDSITFDNSIDSSLILGCTNLAEPLVWRANVSSEYTESHNPDWSTDGGNDYSHGSGKGIILPEGDFNARGQWVKGNDASVTYQNVPITSAEGHFAIRCVWTDDALVFTVPVYGLPAGKAVQFQTGMYGTAAIPKLWAVEFSNDSINWTLGQADNYYTSTQNGQRANFLFNEAKKKSLCSATYTDYPVITLSDTLYVRVRCVDGSLTITGKKAVTTPGTTAAVRFCDYGDIAGPTLSLVEASESESTDLINGTAIQEGNNLCGMIADESGAGIAGVPVTDGFHFVLTDANGVYQMKANEKCRKVYYTLPADYQVAKDSTTLLPLFYSTRDLDLSTVNRRDFVLKKRTHEVQNLKIVAIADPQVNDADDIARFNAETMAEIRKTNFGSDELVGLVLGDLIDSQNKMWADIKKSLSNVENIPFYCIQGNHDLDITASNQFDAEQLYYNYMGPVDYSFNIGQVHFICMNNVQGTSSDGTSWTYESGLTDSQIQWLQEDLANVQDKEEKMCVLAMHICINDEESKYATLLKSLTLFNDVHILMGHSHLNWNLVHDNYKTQNGLPIYEHVQGAACGAYWTSALNTDDSPINYDVYEIHGNTMYDWYYKPVGYDQDWQMRVFNGNDSYSGDKGYTYSWAGGHTSDDAGVAVTYDPNMAGCFVASVWNCDDHYWDVELYQNGQKLGDMTRAAASANASTCAYYCNGGHNKALYTPAYNLHHYYWKPATGDPSAVQGWEIIATQTIPESGVKHVYKSSVFQDGYEGYKTLPAIE